MTDSPKFLSALVFARPEVSAALNASLYISSGKPIQVLSTFPTFSANTVNTVLAQFNPDIVVVESGVLDYNIRTFSDIRFNSKTPILLVGMAPVGSSEREEMLGAQLDAVYILPFSKTVEDQMCAELPKKFETVKSEWKKGAWSSASPDLIRAAAAEAGGASWERGCIAVWSPKGGVGKTTVSIELAVALSGIAGKKVALIDANMNGGHIRIRLDVKSDQSIVSAAMAYKMDRSTESNKREMNERISDCLVKVSGNQSLNVLTGVTNMDQAGSTGLNSEDGEKFMVYLIEYLKRVYDFVIVDMGSSLNVGVHVGTLLKADRVLVVATPDMTSMADAKAAIHQTIIPKIGLDLSRFGLVINDWQDGLGITLAEAAAYIGIPAIGVVPINSDGLVTMCGNKGVSFVAHYMSNKDNSASIESTLDGFVTLASHFYPPVGSVWSGRSKNAAKQGNKKGLFGMGGKK